METLLVHHTVAAEFLPVISAIYLSKGVELRGCPRAQEIIGAQVKPASEDD
jgi:glutamate-5-semialdehyde dehydrogenase